MIFYSTYRDTLERCFSCFRYTRPTTFPRTTATRTTWPACRRRPPASRRHTTATISRSSRTSIGTPRPNRTGASTGASCPADRILRTCWWCGHRPSDRRRRGGTCTGRRWPAIISRSTRPSSRFRWSRPGQCLWSCTSGKGRTTIDIRFCANVGRSRRSYCLSFSSSIRCATCTSVLYTDL